MDHKTVTVRLTPKASAERIGGPRTLANGETALSVYVTAPPEKNKANEAMLRLLAKHFGVAASRLTIVSGQAGRTKKVRVE